MTRYLIRTFLAQARRTKSLHSLTVLGVAVGVASVLSIQILNRSALAAFRGSAEAVSGKIDLIVSGRTPTFAERLYVDVLSTPGVTGAWPLYRTQVALRDRTAFIEIVGVDFFQTGGIRLRRVEDIANVVTTPGWVALAPAFASDRGWQVGDTISVTSGSRQTALILGALVDFQAITPFASPKLAVMDISQAQALFGHRGQINQIDVQVVDPDSVAAVAERLKTTLGSVVDVLSPKQREQRASGLVSAFSLNLTALSLISLLVGLFLVFSSTQALLTRRRTEFGILRSLGATRHQILVLVLAEVAILGAVGTLLGLPLGVWVAQANVGAVSATITNFYLLNEIQALDVSTSLYLLAAGIGIGGAVVGAIVPSVDMSRRDPKALLSPFTLHERLRRLAVPLALTALALCTIATTWFLVTGSEMRGKGFVLAFAVLLTLPLVTPAVIAVAARPFRAKDFGPRYAIRSLDARIQTMAVAVAALAVAVCMLTGITVMIGSFRKTLEVWIDTSVRADVYISTESWARSTVAAFDSTLVSAFQGWPGVIAVDRLRRFFAYTGDRRVSVAGFDMRLPINDARFPLFEGNAPAAAEQLRTQGHVLISEPLARKLQRWSGDSLELATPTGVTKFPVAGVFYDYSTESGLVVMDHTTMDRHYGNGAPNSIALYLANDVDPEQVIDAIRARYDTLPLVIRSNQRIREQALRIFDQTFAITRILQAMSLVVAAAGIMLTLLIFARERVAELALYRALGAVRKQIFWLFVGKGSSIAILGVVLGVLGGSVLAMILIFVINRAYFGWTIQVHWPWAALIEQGATIGFAAIAASLYPAARASKTPAIELSREDLW